MIFFKGEDPVYGTFFLHGKDGDEIQWDNEHQQMQQQHTVCRVRSMHRTWRTHGLRGGGGAWSGCTSDKVQHFRPPPS